MKIVLCSLIFSEIYLKEIKKQLKKDYTIVITPLNYMLYKNEEPFIFIYGNKMNEKQKTVQLRTSLNKTNHYNISLHNLLKDIHYFENLMGHLA